MLKELKLLNVEDMFLLKILKFLRKLPDNELPPYLDIYLLLLITITTPYSLRPHVLPLPGTAHVFAESGLIYQLVLMKNSNILQKLDETIYSYSGFSKYILKMLEKFS